MDPRKQTNTRGNNKAINTRESKPIPEEIIKQSIPEEIKPILKEARKPTPEEKEYIQQLTDEELRQLGKNFSKAKEIVKAKEAQEAERKRAELEKAKEGMRRSFRPPRLQDQEGFEDLEAIKKTVDALKLIYQPGTLDYEAFHAVIKEMGLE